jgi:hypothetical protein
MPSLSLDSHTASLYYCTYQEREIISKTFFTTKEKSDIVASKSLSTSISSYKNKNEIKRSVLKENEKRSMKNKILDAKKLPCATIFRIGS